MVHRAPDSRLLTNLITHEKEYAKHLAGLFPLSHSALASLSAYAAASPPNPSSPAQSIAAVVDVLAGADDALQRYNHTVETWREQLVSLKNLEDDLTAVLRDRDILVTRLIKASKSTRDSHRSSRLITPLTGLGSVSLSSLPSTNSTAASGPASTNSKLAQAQSELQACEAHLVAKERELDARRISIAREGLGARCRALIDCGWVWGEMGKQGLKALQALSANGVASGGHTAVSMSTPAIPSHLATPYASDNSSLTPSQSASQTAARSAETSHEAASKGHEHTIEPEVELETRSSQTRATRAEEEGDLTITLPPAHAISDLAFPTGVRSQPLQPGDSAAQKQTTSNTNPAPRRKRTKRSRRPPSQHITEVSDEGSDGPPSNRNAAANATANQLVSRTTFPTARTAPETFDTSSEDDPPTGPLKVVENDPFGVIRRSMLSPSASALFMPTAPSASSARPSVADETSPSKAAFPSSASGPGLAPGLGSAKRERRTSMAFFGSIRGLFRKPKDRDRPSTEWDEGHSSPSPSSPNRTNKTNGKGGGGWVTRTDARIKGSRGGEEDSDEEATPTAVPVANMARRGSGARLRKGRPGASPRGIHDNGSFASIPVVPSRRASARVGVDGWITDSPAGAGAGSGIGASTGRGGAGVGQGRSRTRRGTMKRGRTSVADLRGSDQGHTDGEVDDRGMGRGGSSERVSSKAPESVSGPKPDVVDVEEERKLARRGSTSKGALTDTSPTADQSINANASPGIQRATTTTAVSSRKPLPNRTPTHRRSASLSLVHTNVTPVSTSTQGTHTPSSTGGTPSWRKPVPQVEPPSQPESPSQTPPRTQTESQPKQNTRRHNNNGHATHIHKHAQNQSLMSVVADVTRLNENEIQGRDRDRTWLGMDKTRSLDVPRAPGSVLREVDRDRDREPSGVERGMGMGMNGRGHARTSSSPTGVDEGGRGRGQRPIKLPLRSALRNASRTPSPSPASIPLSASATVPEVGEDRVSPSLRDSASISSYETGRESFDVEEGEVSLPSPPPSRSQSPTPRSRTPPPPPLSFTFPPPPVGPPPVSVSVPVRGETTPSSHTTEQTLSSNVSTETPPVRRKSVRVSLQPTFSPTPPALCDDDGEGYAPWSDSFSTRDEAEKGKKGRHTKKGGGGQEDDDDVWADSSEEDEVYSRARRLLSLVGKNDKGKGKARAKT